MDSKRLWIGCAVVVIVLLAGLFRLYDIQNFPPGLFPDEAANGEDALLILDGDVRPFYPRGNGREGLYFYLEALSIKWFGIGVWQLHIVSALIGTATVLAMYFATRVWFGRLAGLLAALLLATSHWHVTMSRTGFRAILIPLFIALFTAWVGYCVRAIKLQKPAQAYMYAALAGAAWAGGFYTYIAYRVMVGVVVGILGLLIIASWHPKIGFPHWRRYGKQVVVGILAALLVLSPLVWHFVQAPEEFVGRAGQVSVFNTELQDTYGGGTLVGTILYSARETLLSFFAGDGDLNWRHNVAGFPLLNPLVGMLFLAGLTWALRGLYMVSRKIMSGVEIHLGMIFAYLLLILLGMLAPVISTAEGMPHGLRSIGLVFPIFVLAGVAGAVMLHWCQRRFARSMQLGACFGIAAGLLLVGVLYDGSLYFLISRNDARAHYSYRADLIDTVNYITSYRATNPELKPYLVLDRFSLQSTHFLLSVTSHDHTIGDERHPDEDRHEYVSVEPAESHLLELKEGDVMIFTQSTIFDAERYAQTYDNFEVIDVRYNRFGEEIMRVLRGTGAFTEGDVKGDTTEDYGLDA